MSHAPHAMTHNQKQKAQNKPRSNTRALTKRKRAAARVCTNEHEYRSIFENAVEGIFRTSPEGRLLRANPAFARMFGYASPEEMIDVIYDLARQLYVQPEVRTGFVQRIKEHGLVENYEAEMYRKTGEKVWISINGRAVKNARGRLVFIDGTNVDITERKRDAARLQTSREQLRALTSRVQSLREEERTQIAREIHDHLGQLLTGLTLELRLLQRKITNVSDMELREALDVRVASVRELADQTISAVQKIASDLRPGILDKLGLKAALEVELEAFRLRTGLDCVYRISHAPSATSSVQATAIFRIFQEILTNIARHAQATRVSACMEPQGDALVLTVEDDGVGIQCRDIGNPKSLGILGMQERALILGGNVSFNRREERGTIVTVRIPFEWSVCPQR